MLGKKEAVNHPKSNHYDTGGPACSEYLGRSVHLFLLFLFLYCLQDSHLSLGPLNRYRLCRVMMSFGINNDRLAVELVAIRAKL
jgi:hypothetical protein